MKRSRKEPVGPHVHEMSERVKKMTSPEMLDMMDNTVSVLGDYYSGYRKTRDLNMLAELELHAEMLMVLANESLNRVNQRMVSGRPTRQVKQTVRGGRPY